MSLSHSKCRVMQGIVSRTCVQFDVDCAGSRYHQTWGHAGYQPALAPEALQDEGEMKGPHPLIILENYILIYS